MAERPRELVNEGDVRRANGIADVGVGSLWLAVDLAERPSLGDVGAFVTIALVFFGAFAALQLPHMRRLGRAAAAFELGAAPAGAKVRRRAATALRAARFPAVIGSVVLLISWGMGAEFRDETLDVLGGMASGVGAAGVWESIRLRRIETDVGGAVVRAPRAFFRVPRVKDYYVLR